MKRLTKKVWFGKKKIGWGWRPASWQGWLVTLIFLMVFFFNGLYFRNGMLRAAIFISALAAYIMVVILTGDRH